LTRGRAWEERFVSKPDCFGFAAPEICYMRMYLLKYFKTKVGLFIFKQIGTGSKNQLITFFNCKSLKSKAITLQKIRKLVKK